MLALEPENLTRYLLLSQYFGVEESGSSIGVLGSQQRLDSHVPLNLPGWDRLRGD